MEDRHSSGMSDEARRLWRIRRHREQLAVEARREWLATLPDIDRTPTEKAEAVEPEPEYVVQTSPARPHDGDSPSAVRSLAKAADKAGFSTLISISHQERRGSHGRLLDPPEADVLSVLGVRGPEKFIADWEHVYSAKTDKWSWKTKGAMIWSPFLQFQPSMVTVNELKKEHLT